MLSVTTSIVPHNCVTLPIRSCRRSQVYSSTNPHFHLATSKHNHKRQFLGNQKMKIFTTTLEVQHHERKRKDMTVYSTGVESGLPFPLPFELPFDLNPGSWQTWVLGVIIALTPFGISTWWPILKSKVDSVIQTAEAVAETVEKVADKVDEVAEDIADRLPEGKLKRAARFIENIAEEAEMDAHLVDETIEKLEAMEIELHNEAERLIQANAKTKEAQNS